MGTENLVEVLVLARDDTRKSLLLLYTDKIDSVTLTEEADRSSSSHAPESNFFQEAGQSLDRISQQMNKPLNTLAGLGGPKQRMLEYSPSTSAVPFSSIRSVTEKNGKLVVTRLDGKQPFTICLAASPISPVAQIALCEGLLSAWKHTGKVANWSELHAALHQEVEVRIVSTGPQGAGERKLQVFEVQRRRPMSNEWSAKYLPTDRGLDWRWVDTTGRPHPLLSKDLSQEQCVACSKPPCELGDLYHAATNWAVQRTSNTDEDGWMYGFAWNTASWSVEPGLFDYLRRRVWIKSYR